MWQNKILKEIARYFERKNYYFSLDKQIIYVSIFPEVYRL